MIDGISTLLSKSYFKHLAFIVFTFVMSMTCFAQRSETRNLPNYDDKFLHYGFHLGTNYTIYRVKHSDYFLEQDSVQTLYPKGSVGFNLGFVVNMRVNDFFDLRALPTVAFYERSIDFGFRNEENNLTTIFESTFIELPLLLKYKSTRRKNSRFYMVAGIKPGVEVGAGKNEKKNDQLRVNNFDLSIEYGLGLDVYNMMFKFAPEIRFSLGLLNLFKPDDNVYANNIDRISTFTTTLNLLFE